MNKDLEKLMQAERKNRRWLAELRVTRKRIAQEVDSPDRAKRLKLIDEEIASILK